MTESPLTAKRLRELLHYDPETGVFTWRVSRGKWSAGHIAGCKVWNDLWYEKIKINRRMYYAHRLAWLYMTNRWPKDQVDHKDGDSLNNKWANLRQATAFQNTRNAKKRAGCSSQYKGVCFHVGTSKWNAQIHIDGTQRSLGYFDSEQDAYQAYCKAAHKYYGEYARVK